MSIIYIIGFVGVCIFGIIQIYLKYITKWCKSKVCLVGKTVIVTGANAGIGYETSLELAKRGARVILACRDQQRGSAAVESIKRLTENENVTLKLLDLASFKSINNFVDDIIKNKTKIDVLVNNAGAWGLGDKLSEDGLQMEWQINHYGPVLLTLRLLDSIKKSSPSRIISVSSMAARFSKLTMNTLSRLNNYDNDNLVYCDTKLCNILFTQKLAKLLQDENVSVFSVHPGPVDTPIITGRWSPKLKFIGRILTRLFFLTPEEGAQTQIHTVCEQGIEHLSGSHFEYCHAIKPYKAAINFDLAETVWKETLKFIKYDEIK
ncbi:unnamed protein product [Psylliodes chrysocephalus]|uniref:Uncharacterized protein n=1 Tax=Psylliodes chrysocephalus TaxID=3402493 RepID=A0A9P0G8G4_9CUCU|nr:unnamed protein product [Psylliodes chrysocephala]